MCSLEEINQQLHEAQAQMAEKNRLEARRRNLQKQLEPLEEKERALRSRRYAEQADVDRLQGRSLANLFYAVTGKMDEKRRVEMREAYEAAVLHDAAVQELESVQADLRSTASALHAVSGCERRYEQALEQKKQLLCAQGGADAQRIEQIEKALAACATARREIEEAIRAGRQAQSIAQAALQNLDSAGNWGTWDLIGGGLVSDAIKHDHIDNAQTQIEQLQVQLRRFRTELADVEIFADMQVRTEGFLRFADFFFDDLVSAWVVLDRVNQSKAQIEQVQQQIAGALHRLETMLDETERTALRLEGEQNTILLA